MATVSGRTERRSLGLTLAFTTLLLWGALPVVLKLLLQSLDPFTVTWYRFLLAGAMLAPVVHFRYGLASPFRIRGAALALAVVCVLGLGGNYLTYLMGLSRISPGSAQIVMQFSPIIVLLGGLILFKEAFSRLQWIGLGVLIVGMGLFFNQRFAELLFVLENYGIGVWLVFTSAILWGVFHAGAKTPAAAPTFDLNHGLGLLVWYAALPAFGPAEPHIRPADHPLLALGLLGRLHPRLLSQLRRIAQADGGFAHRRTGLADAPDHYSHVGPTRPL